MGGEECAERGLNCITIATTVCLDSKLVRAVGNCHSFSRREDRFGDV